MASRNRTDNPVTDMPAAAGQAASVQAPLPKRVIRPATVDGTWRYLDIPEPWASSYVHIRCDVELYFMCVGGTAAAPGSVPDETATAINEAGLLNTLPDRLPANEPDRFVMNRERMVFAYKGTGGSDLRIVRR